MNSSHYEEEPYDRTLCGLPVEGVWIVPDTHLASCKICRAEKDRRALPFLDSLLGKGSRVAVNEPKFISITLDEFRWAVDELSLAQARVSFDKFSSGATALEYKMAVKILEHAVEHLTRRLEKSLVGHV